MALIHIDKFKELLDRVYEKLRTEAVKRILQKHGDITHEFEMIKEAKEVFKEWGKE